MNSATAAVNPNQGEKALDILQVVLSDVLFIEFEPMYWSANYHRQDSGAGFRFTTEAFPVLAKYHLGKEADKLVETHQWLADLESTIPSNIQKASRIFHQDSAHNLTILEVFIKLQYLKIWGSAFMHKSLDCCLCYEMYKIIDKEQSSGVEQQRDISDASNTHGQTSDARRGERMYQEFGEQWRDFLKG